MIRIAICDDEAYMSDIIGKMVSDFFRRKNMDIEKNFTKMMERLFLSLQDAGEANLLVQKGYESRIVSFDDIVFCEVIDRKVYLHLASSEVVDFYDRIENLETKLDGRFFRCHRSFQRDFAVYEGVEAIRWLIIWIFSIVTS